MLFILAAIAGKRIYDSSLRPTLSVILYHIITHSLIFLLLYDVDGQFSVLFNLVIENDDESLSQSLPVEELCDGIIFLLVQTSSDPFQPLSPDVTVLLPPDTH